MTPPKRQIVAGYSGLAALLAGSLMSACIVVPAPGYGVGGVMVAPPAQQGEVSGVAPGPDYFWVDGYWNWLGVRHVWVGGHWEAGRSGYRWSPHRWQQDGSAWRASPGHWERH